MEQIGGDLRSWKELDRWLGTRELEVIISDRGMAILTRPSANVMVSTKCEVNMTKKYRVESFAMVLTIPGAVVFLVRKTISKNAKKSDQ